MRRGAHACQSAPFRVERRPGLHRCDCLLGAVAPAHARAATAATADGGLVALGDSITFGYNLPGTFQNTDPDPQAYPYYVANTYHMPVSDLGVPDWTSADLLQALAQPAFARAVRQAEVVTIDIGNNDLLGLAQSYGLLVKAEEDPTAPMSLTPAQAVQMAAAVHTLHIRLNEIVTRVKRQTNAPIVLINEYDPFPSDTGIHRLAEGFIPQANAVVAAVGARFHLPVVNAYAAFNGYQTYYVLPSDVHPTIAGQEALAQAVEAVLTPLVAKLPRSVSPTSRHAAATSLAVVSPTPGTPQTVRLGRAELTLALPTGKACATDGNCGDPSELGKSARPGILRTPTGRGIRCHVSRRRQTTASRQADIPNCAIGARASVYRVIGNRLVKLGNATVRSGEVTVAASSDAEYVILSALQNSGRRSLHTVTGRVRSGGVGAEHRLQPHRQSEVAAHFQLAAHEGLHATQVAGHQFLEVVGTDVERTVGRRRRARRPPATGQASEPTGRFRLPRR